MRNIFWWVLFALAAPGVSWAQTDLVVVYFNPSSTTVTVGQTFTVDIMADIPAELSVLGWGLDMTVNPAILAQTGAVVIGPLWEPLPPVDGDDLVAMVPFDSSGVSGTKAVLATLTFQAVAVGTASLVASVTAGDDAEGFALDPIGFAEVTFQNGLVTVQAAEPPVQTPAVTPLGLVILAGLLGLFGVRMRRRV